MITYNFKKIYIVCNTELRLGLPASVYPIKEKCECPNAYFNLLQSNPLKNIGVKFDQSWQLATMWFKLYFDTCKTLLCNEKSNNRNMLVLEREDFLIFLYAFTHCTSFSIKMG